MIDPGSISGCLIENAFSISAVVNAPEPIEQDPNEHSRVSDDLPKHP